MQEKNANKALFLHLCKDKWGIWRKNEEKFVYVKYLL